MIYSFRAECMPDLEKFKKNCAANNLQITNLEFVQDKDAPDVEVQFESTANIELLRTLMCAVVDGHVMAQTLRPVPRLENSMIRDTSL